MAQSAQLDNTNAITGIFCSLRGSVQGRSTGSSRRAAQTQALLRERAMPDLATSLSRKAAEKIYTGLQQCGSKNGSRLDQNELNWLGFTNFMGQEFLFGATGIPFFFFLIASYNKISLTHYEKSTLL